MHRCVRRDPYVHRRLREARRIPGLGVEPAFSQVRAADTSRRLTSQRAPRFKQLQLVAYDNDPSFDIIAALYAVRGTTPNSREYGAVETTGARARRLRDRHSDKVSGQSGQGPRWVGVLRTDGRTRKYAAGAGDDTRKVSTQRAEMRRQ